MLVWTALLFALIAVAFIRELFGSGTLWGYKVVPNAFYELGYKDNGFMILAPMALIVVGAIIWIQRSRNPELVESN